MKTVNRAQAPFWYSTSFSSHVGEEKLLRFGSKFADLVNQQIEIIEPLGWTTTSTYLECLAMVSSEVRELLFAENPEHASEELADILIRVGVLLERLRRYDHQFNLDISMVLHRDTVIDNRLAFLQSCYPELEDWCGGLLLKTAGMTNLFRDENLNIDNQLDISACCCQIFYMCFLLTKFDQKSRLGHSEFLSTDATLSKILESVQAKVDFNRVSLPKKHRYK